jgi:hypothetical protein
MISTGDPYTDVKALLLGISQAELTELCIEALRRWRATRPDRDVFQMHGALAVHLLPLLAQRKAPVPHFNVHTHKEIFLKAQGERWMKGVVEFAWWMVRAGLATPAESADNGSIAVAFRLTRAGEEFLDAPEDHHPLLPGGILVVLARCPDLPDGIAELLADSRRCMDHRLMRPAVILMGLAYEETIDSVIDALDTRGLLSKKSTMERSPAERIQRVVGVLDKAVADGEERRTAARAYDFAELLRRRRNDGAHPRARYDFDKRAEIEELLVSAVRHLPGLWAPATPT